MWQDTTTTQHLDSLHWSFALSPKLVRTRVQVASWLGDYERGTHNQWREEL